MLISSQVVEVVSGDCIIVADDAAPYGSPSAERRINLSSIRAPKLGNARRDEKPENFAREAKEFLRTRLIGKQVSRLACILMKLINCLKNVL
jgi:staphylococcal nuclease domain-containing protein 1